MKKHLIFLLILLVACSSNTVKEQPKQSETGTLKIYSEWDLNYSVEGLSTKQIKAGTIDEIYEVPKGMYNYTSWSDEFYLTKGRCITDGFCSLRPDKKGKIIIESINETSFKIILNGDVRNGTWCLSYKNMIYIGTNATEKENIDKTKYDHCYLAENNTINLGISGNGNYSVFINKL